jgi:hypothetical protein
MQLGTAASVGGMDYALLLSRLAAALAGSRLALASEERAGVTSFKAAAVAAPDTGYAQVDQLAPGAPDPARHWATVAQ